MNTIDIFALFDIVFRLFSWAWTWQLPILGMTIYPIQAGLFIIILDTLSWTLLPFTADWEE